MHSCSLTYGITTLANIIAEELSDGELAVVGALFTQLGDTLATISVQRALCSTKEPVGSAGQFRENTCPRPAPGMSAAHNSEERHGEAVSPPDP